MNRFKECYDNNCHDWRLIYNSEDSTVTSIGFRLECYRCPATTENFTDEDIMIGEDSIADLIATEDEKVLASIDDQRIAEGIA